MSTVYDDVHYPNLCQPQTHPDRLATVAGFFGLDPAPPDRCRVLELGCGDGANLFPLAWSFPSSRFVGIDLARSVIESGRRDAAALGLGNVELVSGDLREYLADGEAFDYIVAHGVYSWVPAEVRDGLLALCRRRLAPQGIAFVSYNCLPGCHLRRMARDIMRFHTRQVSDPGERVRQAVAVCQFVAHSIEKPDTYRQLLKDQLEQIQRYGAGHLFHDDLAEINDPVYFHEFVAHAARHGLQFLAEADFFEMPEFELSPEARAILRRMDDDRLTQEQYLDFIKCRRFRQTLLCRASIPLRLPADPGWVRSCEIGSQAAAGVTDEEPGSRTVVRFSEPKGGAIEVDYPLAKAALRLASERWPSSLGFNELFRRSLDALPPGTVEDDESARLCLSEILLAAYRAGVIDLRRTPVRCAHRVPERPRVWEYARHLVRRRGLATTLRGDNLRVDDEEGRRLVELLDGSRDRAALRREMEHLGAGSEPAPGGDALADRLEHRLGELARFALLQD